MLGEAGGDAAGEWRKEEANPEVEAHVAKENQTQATRTWHFRTCPHAILDTDTPVCSTTVFTPHSSQTLGARTQIWNEIVVLIKIDLLSSTPSPATLRRSVQFSRWADDAHSTRTANSLGQAALVLGRESSLFP